VGCGARYREWRNAVPQVGGQSYELEISLRPQMKCRSPPMRRAIRLSDGVR